jgi:hypothetical protein
MTWPEATELLYRERLSAETCARVMKRFLPAGDAAALTAAERDYEEARGLVNGVIVNLQMALIEDAEAPALETVRSRMEAGTEARRAYCDTAGALMPPEQEGEKGVIGDIVEGVVGPIVEAVVTIWGKIEDKDQLRRDSIRSALEDTKWPAFASIQP